MNKRASLTAAFIVMIMVQTTYSFIRIGHRGACGYEPENTLRSFEKAIELGVDMIELDVYQCASHELVVMHDNDVNRTTNGHGPVESKTLAQLKLLDAGKGEKIPTLQEVFDLVNRRVKIDIELKGSHTAQATADLIYCYVNSKGWHFDDFYVSSFDHQELMCFHAACPRVKIGGLYEDSDKPLAAFKRNYKKFYAIGIAKNSLTQEYIDRAHKKGLKIFVYTVNDADEIKKMKAMGVDGIFSNYPDRFGTSR